MNALLCSIEELPVETEEGVNLHTNTCKRYSSIHAFYGSIHSSNTRRVGGEIGSWDWDVQIIPSTIVVWIAALPPGVVVVLSQPSAATRSRFAVPIPLMRDD